MPNKNEFINNKWNPFLEKLNRVIAETACRASAGYDLADRLPPQQEIDRLAQECYKLTQEFYGVGKENLSVMHKFLIKASVVSGITFYNPVKHYNSNDGTLVLHDRRYVIQAINDYTARVRVSYISQGGRIVRGRSSIDNSVIPNIFLAEDASRILARRGMLRWVSGFMNRLNRKRGAIAGTVPTHIKPIENGGQLPSDTKQKIWDYVCAAIPAQNHASSIGEFVEFLHKTPGVYFANDSKKHRELLADGLRTRELRVINPKLLQNTMPHRHVKIRYKRTIPLICYRNGQRELLIPAGVEEIIYLRPNEMPYLKEHHGLSLPSGEFFTCGLPRRSSAFGRDNIIPDVEWMVAEALAYNSARELPEESAVMVGRNSVVGSSIQQTAHGHIFCAELSQFRHYMAENQPMALPDCDASIDFLQLGTNPDTSVMKVLTPNPRNINLLHFLSEMLLSLKEHFGEHNVDLLLQIIPHQNQFAIILLPFAMLQKNDLTYTNPNNQDSNIAANTVEHAHIAHCAGFWSYSNEEQKQAWEQQGLQHLRRLFDFTSLPGSLQAMQKIVSEHERTHSTRRGISSKV